MRRRPPALLAFAGVVLVAGCSATIPTTVAPHATDPVCADVVLSTPDELSGLERRDTNAQATTAWGDPEGAIVLRCGVEPLGPTTDRCVTVESPDGTSVDWVVTQGDSEDDDGAATFVTYGRVPAVEVRVPASVRAQHSTSLLIDLGAAVSRTEKQRACL
ncbi:DUF3515 domain-containing protein [Cellulomonas edaphi]|uniref:DUF3515 domain-containing protein n=1 Tax=Cellulomonas edaphi TaxID=3053468 RepID=A0ABT7S7U9_9CELL|nr:DUF3515 domain-containing protein [Cellulomons edaphi]MDM7831703.1 DUF3515 domain-containing protein [Cellulomons edaphi]